MKSEELFDLLEFTDDRYIEEAICCDFDSSRPVEVRAGKSRITPIKIIAPIAACLAVAIGAGVVISNKDKLAMTPADSAITTSGAEQNSGRTFATEEEFIEHCKRIVSSESELIRQSETTWYTGKLDVDFDGEDELLIYPQIDEKTVPEVGVRVFRKTENGAEGLGAFGKSDDSIDLNDIRRDDRVDAKAQYYYCFSHDDKDGLYDGIRFVSYNEEENTVSDEKYLMRVTDNRTNGLLTEGTFENGQHAGSEQSFIVKIRDFPDDISERFCEFTKAEIAKCEKDALTRNDKLELEELLTSRMWHVGEYDINYDGEKELLISLYNFTNMRGVFVYDKNCEYLGSFETENGLCDPELLELYDRDGERYWYYLGIEGPTVRDGSSGVYATWLERASINKIIVENNSFSTERLIHYDIIWDKNSYSTEDHRVYWIGDKEVTEEEYRKADVYLVGCMGSHEFDLTDPDEWKYSSMFEDSQLHGKDIGQANIERPSRFETSD